MMTLRKERQSEAIIICVRSKLIFANLRDEVKQNEEKGNSPSDCPWI